MSPRPTPLPSRRALLLGALTTSVAASTWGCGARDGRPGPQGQEATAPSSGTEMVVLQVDGERFRPAVEVTGEVEVLWVDARTGTELGTGIAPDLSTGSVLLVGLVVRTAEGPALDAVTTLNLGFRRDDDYGPLSLPSTYEHPPQPVTGIFGLSLLTGLVRFCASRTPLSGCFDLRGLSALEHVECYGSEIDDIDLEGCSSLRRLVVEKSRLTQLDLGPVRSTLQDLRAAALRSESLTITALDGPRRRHSTTACASRCSTVGTERLLPVVEEYWAWTPGCAPATPRSPRADVVPRAGQPARPKVGRPRPRGP